jgi:SAM-dependent methyltransferase
MASDEYFDYQGFRIPLRLLPLAGDHSADEFPLHCEHQIGILERLFEIRPNMDVLGIGCGLGRDAIPLTKILSPQGSYLGIDVQRELVDWNRVNITERHPNFRFSHAEIKEPWFNPEGTVALSDYRLPVEDASIDLVILFSVFTHMLPDSMRFYLGEFRRVLRRAGRVYATVFLLNDEILSHQTPAMFSFDNQFDDGCYILEPEHPTKGVGYRFAALNKLVQQAGLEFAIPPLRGFWSGLSADMLFGGQDSIVLRRQDPPNRLAAAS